MLQNVATDGQPADSAAEPNSAENTEMSSSLSVQQDFSKLTCKFSDNSSSVDDVNDGKASDVTSDAEGDMRIEQNEDLQDEANNEPLQPDKSSNLTSYDMESLAVGEHYKSLPSYTELPCDDFRSRSSRHRDDVHSGQMSENKSKKKMSFKGASTERTSSADKGYSSPAVKKLQHKTPTSPPKLRTSSGVFTVYELTNAGEKHVLTYF